MSNPGQVLVPVNNISFTNLNLTSGANVVSVGTSNLLYMPVSNTNVRGQYITAPSTPYCLIANICSNMGDYNSSTGAVQYGIGFYDGTKLVDVMGQWSYNTTMALYVTQRSGVTASSTVFGSSATSGQPTSTLQWFQIRDDGTSIYFYVCFDQVATDPNSHWVQLYSQSRTAYLSAPTYIYWAGCNNGNSGKMYLTLNSWQTVSL